MQRLSLSEPATRWMRQQKMFTTRRIVRLRLKKLAATDYVSRYFQIRMLSLFAPLFAGVFGSIILSGPADHTITDELASKTGPVAMVPLISPFKPVLGLFGSCEMAGF